ncbi:MAG: radical SAM protein, partial [Candidatus Pacearchaeota archaeon]
MRREKILLVRAPNLYKSKQWKKQGVLRTPTNLALLASFAREFGQYEPEIIDFELHEEKDFTQIANIILSRGARYVGFTTLTPRFPTILKICDALKKIDKDVVTIIGGPHISGRPQDCRYSSIDYGVIGEGEEAFVDLLNALVSKNDASRLDNIVSKENGIIRINKRRPFIRDLDALPLPAWDLLDMTVYTDPPFFGEEPHAGVFTTRGCPQECIFCASKVTWERKLRFRSIDNVINELIQLTDKFKVHNLYFYDDHFAAKPSRAVELCNRMISEGLNMRYIVQLRADSVNTELADALKKSGCLSAALGIESGNEAMLKLI